MRNCVLLLLVFLAWTPMRAVADTYGCPVDVFADDNGNGRRDVGEVPLANVAIANRYDVRRTDAAGRVWFLWHGGDFTLIKPAGWRAPLREDGLPDLWRVMSTERAGEEPWPIVQQRDGQRFYRDPGPAGCGEEFGLIRDPRPAGELRVLLFSDTQTRDAREVDFYGRGIVAAVRNAHSDYPADVTASPHYEPGAAGDLGLTLGDITNDNPALYPDLNRLTTSLGAPWLHAPGNHDVDMASTTDADSLASFQAIYGPDTYAWEEHEAVFIVLDDVIWQPGQSPKYIGGLREEQFRFLETYLPTVNFQKRVVIAAHMPFFDDKPGTTTFRPADRERLFALLQRFDNVLLLTGHGHVQRQHFHDESTGWHGASPLHEYNVGAACGSYWSGDADADGIPTSMMADGTPKGWAEMTIREHGDYSLQWNVAEAGVDRSTAIALHAPQALRRGSWPGFAVTANVFMGLADVRVEYRIDDGDWAPMQRVDKPDPRLVAINVRDDAATALGAFDRLPEAAPSTHLWRGALPTNLASGEHRIQVRAYDPWRGELSATTTYRLLDPSR